MSFMQPMMRASALRSARPLSTARLFSSTAPSKVAQMTMVGRLTGPPELAATSTGNEILRYTVATNSTRRDAPASFFRVTAFESEGPRRDYFLDLPKGTLVYVEADSSMRQYEDKEGISRTTLNLVHRRLEVLSRPKVPTETSEGGAEELENAA